MRAGAGPLLLLAPAALLLARPLALPADPPPPARPHVRFVDVADALGIDFRHLSSSTSRKYLPETMGSGVALLDYDGDGRLDVFFANGARIDDPMPAGTLPVKDAPRYWNRLYRQKPDGRFEDVTVAAGLAGSGYSQGVAVGDYDNDGDQDLYVDRRLRQPALSQRRRRPLHRRHGRRRRRRRRMVLERRLRRLRPRRPAGSVRGPVHGVVVRQQPPLQRRLQPDPRALAHRPPRLLPPQPLQGKGGPPLPQRRRRHASATSPREAGVANPDGKSLGVALADFDGDGFTDIFVANDSVQ